MKTSNYTEEYCNVFAGSLVDAWGLKNGIRFSGDHCDAAPVYVVTEGNWETPVCQGHYKLWQKNNSHISIAKVLQHIIDEVPV